MPRIGLPELILITVFLVMILVLTRQRRTRD